jgi:hypothetical protein
MPLEIPSTSSSNLGTVELEENGVTVHYQQMVISDLTGQAMGTYEVPIPVLPVVSGYVYSYASDKTVLPVGGVYISESITNANAELVENELFPFRMTAKGSIKTAADGQVNELVSSLSTGYDDIYVTENSFSAANLTPLSISGAFFDTSRTNVRYVYIPLIRSGWRSLSFSFKSAASGEVALYMDYGAVEADLLADAFQVAANTRYAVLATSASGAAFKAVPALSSPANGVIVCFTPAESAAGTLEFHITRGS